MYNKTISQAPVDCTFLEAYQFEFVRILIGTVVVLFLHVTYIFLNVTPVDVRVLDKHTIFRAGR